MTLRHYSLRGAASLQSLSLFGLKGARLGLGLALAVALLGISPSAEAKDSQILAEGIIGGQTGTGFTVNQGTQSYQANIAGEVIYGGSLGSRMWNGAIAKISFLREESTIQVVGYDNSATGTSTDTSSTSTDGTSTDTTSTQGLAMNWYLIGGEQEWAANHSKTIFGTFGLQLGALQFVPSTTDSVDYWRFSGLLEVGIRAMMTKNFSIKLGLGGFATYMPEQSNFYCANGRCLSMNSGTFIFQGNATAALVALF